MDELSEMIGAKPEPLRHMWSAPQLAYRLLFGPNLPYAYRLAGPHPWHGAKAAILNVEKRIAKPLSGRETAFVSFDTFSSVACSLAFAVFLFTFFLISI